MNSTATLPATVADTAAARLPATYEAAKAAIAECERIDECKSWSDKAAALASYARQAKDDSLRVMAVRIQARAERRCGELLKQIPRADDSTRYGHEGAHMPVSRSQAASDAGLSEHQRNTALRLASIPEGEFNRQVESPSPPTVTRLAEQGTATRRTSSRAAMARGLAEACDALATFARFCERTEPTDLARAVDTQDVEAMRQYVSVADQWLDRFVTSLSVAD
ncbi:MAG TPA: hypothetical protein VIH60_04785 [Steroidobacteraceae bacterium]